MGRYVELAEDALRAGHDGANLGTARWGTRKRRIRPRTITHTHLLGCSFVKFQKGSSVALVRLRSADAKKHSSQQEETSNPRYQSCHEFQLVPSPSYIRSINKLSTNVSVIRFLSFSLLQIVPANRLSTVTLWGLIEPFLCRQAPSGARVPTCPNLVS